MSLPDPKWPAQNRCDFCGTISRDYEPWLSCDECGRDVCDSCNTTDAYGDGPDAWALCRSCTAMRANACRICGEPHNEGQCFQELTR